MLSQSIRRKARKAADEKGSALLLALLITLIFSVLGLALATLGLTEGNIAGNWRSYSAAFYGAEAGIESGIVNLKDRLSKTPTPTTAQLNAIVAPALNNPKLSFIPGGFLVMSAGPTYAASMPSGPYGGLSGLVSPYQIISQVQGDNGTRANLTQAFKYVQIPLFQFGVFYGRGVDLEIAPGANMTLNGKVFANSNIYLSPQGGTLQINSLLATAGNIYRTIKRSGVEGYGLNPQIMDAGGTYRTLNFDHVDQQNFSGAWTPTDWMNAANSLFGGTVKDSAMGVTEIIPPVPDLFYNSNPPNPSDPYNPSNPDVVAHKLIELPQASDSPDLAAAKMYAKAGLRIVDGVATNQTGGSVSLPAGAVTTTSFYDAREGETMQITQVDISKLGSAMPTNGALYVASSSASPTAACGSPCPAVRLVNGSTLPSQGLTVVSQNPVYIQGNYNTALSGPGGSNHPPAAVLADAVTVLSSGWSDANSTLGLSSRTATSTTVNAAIATGPSVESALGQGNGQLENDIRLIENWSGKTLTYSGSIVDLWHSLQVRAPWQNTGVYYNAPIRNWSYDTLFSTTPPPWTPMGVIMVRGQWSQK